MPYPYHANDPNCHSVKANEVQPDKWLPGGPYDRYACLPPASMCSTYLGRRNPCCAGPGTCTQGPDDLGFYYCGYHRNARYVGYPGLRFKR